MCNIYLIFKLQLMFIFISFQLINYSVTLLNVKNSDKNVQYKFQDSKVITKKNLHIWEAEPKNFESFAW